MDASSTLKIILIVVLFCITFGSTLLPFVLRSCATSNEGNPRRQRLFMLVFSFLSCYGGGIFVGTCLMDLLPDAKEKLAAGIEDLGITVAKDYPLTEFMVCAGFFLILISEQTGVWFKERKTKYQQIVDERRQQKLASAQLTSSTIIANGQKHMGAMDNREEVIISIEKIHDNGYVNGALEDSTGETDPKMNGQTIIGGGNQHTHPQVYSIAKRLIGDVPEYTDYVGHRDRDFHFHSPDGMLDSMVTKPFQTETTPSCSRIGSRQGSRVGSRQGSRMVSRQGSRLASRLGSPAGSKNVSRSGSKKSSRVGSKNVSRRGSRRIPIPEPEEDVGTEITEKDNVDKQQPHQHTVTIFENEYLESPPNTPVVHSHFAIPLEDDRSSSVYSGDGEEPHQPGEEMIHAHFDPDEHSAMRAILLVFALSLHSLFEGMALGLQSSSANIVTIFIALVIHKSLVSFSLGLRLVQSPLTTCVIIVCDLVFCTTALIGGIVGIVVTEALNAGLGELINGLLQGVACGTFLYITFFEILPHELNPPGFRMTKLLVLLLGFITVSILMFFA